MLFLWQLSIKESDLYGSSSQPCRTAHLQHGLIPQVELGEAVPACDYLKLNTAQLGVMFALYLVTVAVVGTLCSKDAPHVRGIWKTILCTWYLVRIHVVYKLFRQERSLYFSTFTAICHTY